MADQKAEEETRVVLIRPGDVLVISGFRGEFDRSVSDAFGALTQAGIGQVIVFQDEVNLSILTPDDLRTALTRAEAKQRERSESLPMPLQCGRCGGCATVKSWFGRVRRCPFCDPGPIREWWWRNTGLRWMKLRWRFKYSRRPARWLTMPQDRPAPDASGEPYVRQRLAVWPSDLLGECCDLHNRYCEPPGDLCCGKCTEVAHCTVPPHADGSPCVLDKP